MAVALSLKVPYQGLSWRNSTAAHTYGCIQRGSISLSYGHSRAFPLPLRVICLSVHESVTIDSCAANTESQTVITCAEENGGARRFGNCALLCREHIVTCLESARICRWKTRLMNLSSAAYNWRVRAGKTAAGVNSVQILLSDK